MKKKLLVLLFTAFAVVNASCTIPSAPKEMAPPSLEISPPRPERNLYKVPEPFTSPFETSKPREAYTAEKDVAAAGRNVIQSALSQEAVEAVEPAVTVDEDELEYLACTIYQEAGSDSISDLTRYRVGDVVMNRIRDERFPDTMENVLLSKGQYGEFHWTGIKWSSRAVYEPEAVQRAYDTAYDILTDTKHSDLYSQGYIWQSEFVQGSDVIYADGLYFGK